MLEKLIKTVIKIGTYHLAVTLFKDYLRYLLKYYVLGGSKFIIHIEYSFIKLHTYFSSN